MRKLPFLRICLALIMGILCNPYMLGFLSVKILSLLTVFVTTTVSYWLSMNYTKFVQTYGYLTLCLFLLLGMNAAEWSRSVHVLHHFSHLLLAETEMIVEGEVQEVKYGEYGNSYILHVNKILSDPQSSWHLVSGKIQLKSRSHFLSIGDNLLVKGKIVPIQQNFNENSFDYSRFMSLQGVEFFLKSEDVELLSSVRSIPWQTANYIENLIDTLEMNVYAKGLLKAMLLAKKEEIKDITSIFRATGTSHVLAISGLHVGIVSTLLYSLLSFMGRRFRWLKNSIIIVGLWSFCLLSGMGASTVRACIMASCFLVGKMIGEKGFGINFCFMAAFFMLIHDPNSVYNVGFQFSFLAILGILIYYEKIYTTLLLRGWKDVLWKMIALSISAQVLIMPISLYYFHEFPLLFIPASLIAIPVTFLIVAGGILTLMVKSLFPNQGVMDQLLDWLISSFLRILETFSNFNHVIVKDLWPTEIEVLLYYTAIAGLSTFIYFGKMRGLRIYALAFTALISLQFYYNSKLQEPSATIYADSSNFGIEIFNSGTSHLWTSSEKAKKRLEWNASPMRSKKHISKTRTTILSHSQNHNLEFEGKSITILNYDPEKQVDANIVVLLGVFQPDISCKINAEMILDFNKNYHLDDHLPLIRYKQLFIKI